MNDISRLLLERCKISSERYKQEELDKNHLIYCYRCLKAIALVRDEKHGDWHVLAVACPTCLPVIFLATGTNLSEAKPTMAFDLCISAWSRQQPVYSNLTTRGLEGVVRYSFSNLQVLSVAPLPLTEPLVALTGPLPIGAHDSMRIQPCQCDYHRRPVNILIDNRADIADGRKRMVKGYLMPAKEEGLF